MNEGYKMQCISCSQNKVIKELDIGNHPPASFFLQSKNQPVESFNISLGQCSNCGLIQLIKPLPHNVLKPQYDWLIANEPEEHLDDLVEKIVNLKELNQNSVIAGLSYKDDTTIERFKRKGYSNTWRVDLSEDFKVSDKAANIETVQKLTTPEIMEEIARQRGVANLLIVRHITEHTENINVFLNGLIKLVCDNGIIVFEVPDCSNNLQNFDCCMIWEEHSLYLTPRSLERIVTESGLKIVKTIVYERPFENSIVLIARKSTHNTIPLETIISETDHGLLEKYAKVFHSEKSNLRVKLEKIKNKNGPIALYGAGHLAHIFINSMELGDLINFIVDDTPQKQGLFLSGSKLPIVSPSELVNDKIYLCLLALSINIEERIINRHTQFIENGGIFKSIFRESSRSIFIE